MGNNTGDLEKRLKQLKTEKEIDEFICTQKRKSEIQFFYQYLNKLVAEKNISMKEVIAHSHINRNYVYNITNGTKLNPGRDKIIALCIGAHMSYEETNEGLEIGGYCRLRLRNERDVRVAALINMGMYDVLKINIVLEEHGLEPLVI